MRLKSKRYLALEFTALFIGLPLAILFVHQRAFMAAAMWLGAAFAYGVLKRDKQFSFRVEWNAACVRAYGRVVLIRFLFLALLLAAFAWALDPARLFLLPREKTGLWAAIMVLYPLLSALPQELIYRSFLFARYAPLFPTPAQRMLVSAAAFGYAHIIFWNWIAVTFTAVGGLIFAGTYMRSRSLALICLEHALYGGWLFTLGLGWYFYGSAWHPHN